ncbi:MAG TPA: hypothetical protein VGP69_04625 [Gaiellaceae bacterium]|nr:hypothetical protein [Gaiellaceae bacterium]
MTEEEWEGVELLLSDPEIIAWQLGLADFAGIRLDEISEGDDQ